MSLVAVLLFQQVSSSQAPVFQWAKNLESKTVTSTCSIITMVTDLTGHYMLCGGFSGTVDFDPGPGSHELTTTGPNAVNLFIARYDGDGNFLWVQQLTLSGSIGSDRTQILATDNAGNLYITGNFRGTHDFDPGPGIFEMTATAPGGFSCFYLLSLDPSGQFRWAMKMEDGEGIIANAINTDPSGNIILTGRYFGSADFDPGPALAELTALNSDVFVLKLNSSGGFVWVRGFGGGGPDSGIKLSVDATGKIYSAGEFWNTVDFDPGPGTYNLNCSGTNDIYIHCLDPSGNFLWAGNVGSSTEVDRVSGLAIDISGNILVTGFFINAGDFDPGPGQYQLDAGITENVYVVKLNNAGAFVWATTFGGEGDVFSSAISSDQVGNIYTTGSFRAVVDFDPGPINYLMAAKGQHDCYLSAIDPDGALIFARTFGGPEMDGCGALIVNSLNELVSAGGFKGTADFDPGDGIFEMTSIGVFNNTNSFLHKMALCHNETAYQFADNACDKYVWNGLEYTTSGTYMQVFTNAVGCDSVVLLDLTIFPVKHTGVNAKLCEGGTFFAGGAFQTLPGTYYDTLASHQGCDSIITTHLTLKPRPVPDLGADRSFCIGQPATLDPGLFASYVWHDLSTSPTFTASGTGTYWVTVTDADNCSATDTLHFTGITLPPKDFLKATDSLCNLGTLEIVPLSPFSEYLWSTNSTSASIEIQTAGEYWLRATDANGCVGLDTILIHPRKCISGIVFPKAFSPNGDLLNDLFRARVFEPVLSFKLEIYNRSGQRIFMTSDPSKGWDGTLNGKPLDPAVFVWQCTYQLAGSTPAYQKGTITIIR